MPRLAPTVLIAVAALAAPAGAWAGGLGPNALSVRVDPAAGDDARCALVQGSDPRGVIGCRTIAGAAALENAAPAGRPVLVRLEPGRHDVSRLVQFRGDVAMGGPGGVQALVNMVGQGSLRFGGALQAGFFGMTGTASGTWITTSGRDAALFQVTIARARADAPTVTMRGPSLLVTGSVIVAQGHPIAMIMAGGGQFSSSTVSGGRLALSTWRGAADEPAPVVGTSVLAGGIVVWGGQPGIYNSAVSTPRADRSSAVEVRDEPGVAVAQQSSRPLISLSSIWQRSCAPAVGMWRSSAAGRRTSLLMSGSLVRLPAPACSVAVGGEPGPGRGRIEATLQTNWMAPLPGPLPNLTRGLDLALVGGNQVGDPQVEGGLDGRDWPGGMMPAAVSPLLHAATDPWSLATAEFAPWSLSVMRYGAQGARPRAGGNLRNPAPDIGAYERPDLLGAVPPPPPPGPDGIDIQADGAGDGLAPVVNGMDGAIPAAGAPTAGVDTGQRLPLAARTTAARVGLVVPRTAPVAGPVRVRVRAFQASRVVVVIRREFRDDDRVKRSRVIGRKVLRFAKADVRWVNVPLNSGARRGLAGISATARQPGRDPGIAQGTTRLVGSAPVTVSAPAVLGAGANRVTVTTRRAGRVVVVARTATGRVIGRTVFVAAAPGRRVVTLRLAPAGLVTGTITLSARIAGAGAVSITRPAR